MVTDFNNATIALAINNLTFTSLHTFTVRMYTTAINPKFEASPNNWFSEAKHCSLAN